MFRLHHRSFTVPLCLKLSSYKQKSASRPITTCTSDSKHDTMIRRKYIEKTLRKRLKFAHDNCLNNTNYNNLQLSQDCVFVWEEIEELTYALDKMKYR